MNDARKPVALYVLAGLILVEGLALVVATLWLLVSAFSSRTTSEASAFALVVVAAIAAAGLIFVGISTIRARSWVRGAAICWQILQLLLAYSILQAGSPDVAWLLAIPAVVIIVLIFTPRVAKVLARQN